MEIYTLEGKGNKRLATSTRLLNDSHKDDKCSTDLIYVTATRMINVQQT